MKTNTEIRNQFGGVSEMIERRYRQLSKPVIVAFCTAFIAGFIIHIASITGLVVNWDSVTALKDDPLFLISQGKWFTPFLVLLRGFTAFGSIDGVLEVVWLAVTSALLVDILSISTSFYACLLSLTVVAMPSVMCCNSYPFEDTFMASFFLAVLTVKIVDKKDGGFIWGVITLAFSLGIYQAYIGFTAGLFVILCLIKSLKNEDKIQNVVLLGLKYILVLITGILLYYFILRVVLAYLNTTLSAYRNISNMGRFDLHSMAKCAVESYRAVLDFMLQDRFGFGGTDVFQEAHIYSILKQISTHRCAFVYPTILISTVCLFFLVCKQNKLFRKTGFGNLMIAVCMLLLLPMAVHAIGVLGQNSNTHWIMKYPFVLLFVLPIKLMEMVERPRHGLMNRGDFILQAFVTAICVMNIFNWFLITNQGYTALKVAYEGAYNTCVQIADDVTELDAYKPELALYVTGTPAVDDSDMFSEFDGRYTGILDRNFIFYYDTNGHINYILKNYLGLQHPTIDYAAGEKIKATQAFKKMPSFPTPGYVALINDVIVVKTGPNE